MIISRVFVNRSEGFELIHLLIRSRQSVDGCIRGLHLQSWRVEKGRPRIYLKCLLSFMTFTSETCRSD